MIYNKKKKKKRGRKWKPKKRWQTMYEERSSAASAKWSEPKMGDEKMRRELLQFLLQRKQRETCETTTSFPPKVHHKNAR